MGLAATLAVFLAGVVLMVAASELLVRGLDSLGNRLGLRESLLGLVTALGADAPEISSSIAALHAGARDAGFAVALGSNVFNLAALLGLGAIVAGHVRVRRAGLLVDGVVAVGLAALAAVLLLGLVAPVAVLALMLVILGSYVSTLTASPRALAQWRPLGRLARVLAAAASEIEHESRVEHARVGMWSTVAVLVSGLGLVVVGSNLAVVAALSLAAALDVSPVVVASVALAGLTSVPNAYAAVHLARQRRGTAVVSATLHSNTINLVFGVCVPAVAVGTGQSSASLLALAWFAAGTLLALLLLWRRRGLDRSGGLGIIGVYAAFVAVQIALAGRAAP